MLKFFIICHIQGMLASKSDLMEAFNTTDTKAICEEILEKGDLQISELERQALLET
jgi:ribosome maturation protein SDO1